jgi:hypothetical protein
VAEIAQIENAPLPHAEALQAIRRDLESSSAHCVIRRLGDYTSSYRETRSRASNHLREGISLADLALLLGANTLVDAIARYLPATPKAGLPTTQRVPRLTELREALRKDLIDAELETMRLEAEGYLILRHKNFDAKVLLEVWARSGELAAQPA